MTATYESVWDVWQGDRYLGQVSATTKANARIAARKEYGDWRHYRFTNAGPVTHTLRYA